jgi:hypothetical protein
MSIALARKIAVILHRMWINGTTYRWSEAQLMATQAAIPVEFSAYRRRRATQQPSHRSCRLNPSGDLLALRERQCQSRATPCRRTNPTVRSKLEITR